MAAGLAAGTTAGVGGLAAAGVMWLARRSVAAATILAPVAVVVATGAGVLVSARAMFLEDQLPLVLVILAATLPFGVLLGVVLSRRVRQIDRLAARRHSDAQRAAEVEASRRETIAWMSHDLRTPLAGILAMAESLEDGLAPDPQEYIRRIGSETIRLRAMVEDLLALSSLHAGALPTESVRVDVSDLVSDTLATLRPLAERRGIGLAGTAPSGLEVNGDPRQLSRALLNIGMNAVQNSRSGSGVRVDAAPDAQGVRVWVEDECGGIPEADLDRVFVPGWRGAVARTPQRDAGAGLGLAVTFAVVRSHGGSVQATNTRHGCCFTLWLPGAPAPDGAAVSR